MSRARALLIAGPVLAIAAALVPAQAVSASTAAAPPQCFGQAATIVGRAGNDVLNGTAGRDVIVGLGGNDTIDGEGGNDLICGGPGNDTLNGNGGQDKVDGGPGGDVCTAEVRKACEIRG